MHFTLLTVQSRFCSENVKAGMSKIYFRKKQHQYCKSVTFVKTLFVSFHLLFVKETNYHLQLTCLEMQNDHFLMLKSHIHDTHLYSTGNSRALSEEKFVCMRIPPFPTSVCKAQTSAKEKYGFSLVHTQRCTANPHAPIKMAMRSRVIV